MFEGAGQAAIDGAATGFMTGAAVGAFIGGATNAATSACFVEGTPVLAKNGLIPIEEVTAGMMVWSADPETGETALRCVVQTFVRETDELTYVTISDEEGNTETITCTPEHPFYVEGRGWIGAGALHRGMKVRFASGASGIVRDVLCEELQKPVAVYNFEVDDFHTYYVGTTSVLVHNMCAKLSNSGDFERKQQNAKSVIRYLKDNGFEIVKQEGSHVKLTDGVKTVIVPNHGAKDLSIGTLKSILKQAGLK